MKRRVGKTYHSPDSNDPSPFSITLSTRSVLEPVRSATAASNLRPSLHKGQVDGIFAGASDILTLTGVRSPLRTVRQQVYEESLERTVPDKQVYLFKLKHRGSDGVVLDVQRSVTRIVSLRACHRYCFQLEVHIILY